MHCQYAGQCGGCPLIELPYSDQIELKKNHFYEIWKSRGLPQLPEIQFVIVGESGLRDRADLTWHIHHSKKRLGLYDLERSEILDLESCPQMSESLARWYEQIRNIDFPVELGSLRLRVGPMGQKGVWLDFSNLNIKELFDEEKTLMKLLEMGVVEIGQRRKRLFHDGDRLRLKDPVPEHWFQTFTGEKLKPVPLQCSIADFTQPSMKANRMIMAELLNMLKGVELGRVFEFGSGIGNFSIPLAERAQSVEVFERDKYSLTNLERNLESASLQHKVNINKGDYQKIKNRPEPDFENANTVFVDPPRSGLKDFIQGLKKTSSKPAHFLYVSCFAESFCDDSVVLSEIGYQLHTLKMVDQFPQSRHYELMAHFVQV